MIYNKQRLQKLAGLNEIKITSRPDNYSREAIRDFTSLDSKNNIFKNHKKFISENLYNISKHVKVIKDTHGALFNQNDDMPPTSLYISTCLAIAVYYMPVFFGNLEVEGFLFNSFDNIHVPKEYGGPKQVNEDYIIRNFYYLSENYYPEEFSDGLTREKLMLDDYGEVFYGFLEDNIF